jgi:hypothetical protein
MIKSNHRVKSQYCLVHVNIQGYTVQEISSRREVHIINFIFLCDPFYNDVHFTDNKQHPYSLGHLCTKILFTIRYQAVFHCGNWLRGCRSAQKILSIWRRDILFNIRHPIWVRIYANRFGNICNYLFVHRCVILAFASMVVFSSAYHLYTIYLPNSGRNSFTKNRGCFEQIVKSFSCFGE